MLAVASEDRMVEQLRQVIHSAIEEDSDSNEFFMEQLARILEEEEGLALVGRDRRSLSDDQFDSRLNPFVDGSGDQIDSDEVSQLYSNATIIAFTTGITSATLTKYTPQTPSSCRCEKGEKGDPGTCPADCAQSADVYNQQCLGSKINLERLAQSIRQLVADTKKIAFRNARTMSCTCPTIVTPPSSTPVDKDLYLRMKGEKGDPGTSCSPSCTTTSQSNIKVFSTLRQALDASLTYPDHTYVHIVNDDGQLKGVYIHINGRLIPIRIEEYPSTLFTPAYSTTLSSPQTKCTLTLPCPTLHLFALGPHVRRMCHPKRPRILCSKLSEFDDLCSKIAEEHKLKGYYRAFMSTSTQWLSNLFTGVCIDARMVNMQEQILFNSVEDMFEQKPPLNEILDVQGARPRFQYWWHGTLTNGTASKDTCLDWSRQDSNLSGIASRLPDGTRGLFHYQYAWPCSIVDSNMGILCIETNCDKRNYYKH